MWEKEELLSLLLTIKPLASKSDRKSSGKGFQVELESTFKASSPQQTWFIGEWNKIATYFETFIYIL